MEYLKSFWSLLLDMRIMDIVDILVVAFLIYKLLPIFRSTGTSRVMWVIVVVVAVAGLSNVLKLHTLSFLLSQLLAIGLIAIVVLFQPELRRMLDQVSNNIKVKSLINSEKSVADMVPIIEQTVRACEVMSQERVGALIVFARDNRLEEHFKTGTMLDAQVSEQLLRNVFFPKASLHDGAMIIRDAQIVAAGCILPLTEDTSISRSLGTRHRAGVGMSENSDAVANRFRTLGPFCVDLVLCYFFLITVPRGMYD